MWLTAKIRLRAYQPTLECRNRDAEPTAGAQPADVWKEEVVRTVSGLATDHGLVREVPRAGVATDNVWYPCQAKQK